MNLIPNTEYRIEIGAVNSNGGIGPNLAFSVTTRPAQGMKFSIAQSYKEPPIKNNLKKDKP